MTHKLQYSGSFHEFFENTFIMFVSVHKTLRRVDSNHITCIASDYVLKYSFPVFFTTKGNQIKVYIKIQFDKM